MPYPAITPYEGEIPLRSQGREELNQNTADLLSYIPPFVGEVNAAGAFVEQCVTAAAESGGEAAESATLSEEWASKTGSAVDGTEYSAKEHASGTTVPAGSAKEWATSTSEVDGGLKGARGYAQDASASASSAAADATRAESAVATLPEGTIADAIIAPDKAWSSQKINSLLTLDDRLSFKSDFVRDEYFVDAGSRTFAPAEYVWDVVRATSKWVLGANGKYREVPVDTLAREWNPETGEYAAKIEGSATNELLYSTQFDNAAWAKIGVSVSQSTATLFAGMPVGLLTESAASESHYVSANFSSTSGQQYVCSVYVKADGRRFVQLLLTSSGFGGNIVAAFDLETGSTSSNPGGTNSSLSIESVGDGYFRCIFTAQATATATTAFQIRLSGTLTTSPASYQGDGTSGIYIAHAQLEQGTRPTSPIITTDAPVTRAADNISRELGAEFNVNNFTLFCSVLAGQSVAPFSTLFGLQASEGQDRLIVFSAGGGTNLQTVLNLDGDFIINSGNVYPLTNKIKAALNVQQGMLRLFINGDEVYSASTEDADLSSLTEMVIGSRRLGSVFRSNFQDVWSTTGDISPAQLQELTQ